MIDAIMWLVHLKRKTIMINRVCNNCKKDIKSPIRKFCSKSCDIIYKRLWDRITYEDKIERLKEYYDKYVIKQEGCWGWSGTLLHRRGRLQFDHKQIQAHRASWMIHHGKIKDNLWVLHKCDNEICSNPDHLFLGTSSENCIDMVMKDRRPHAKLKVKDVLEIMKMLKDNIQGKIIALKYNVHPKTISDIKLGYCWNHLTKFKG
jgi:hypothetical protein